MPRILRWKSVHSRASSTTISTKPNLSKFKALEASKVKANSSITERAAVTIETETETTTTTLTVPREVIEVVTVVAEETEATEEIEEIEEAEVEEIESKRNKTRSSTDMRRTQEVMKNRQTLSPKEAVVVVNAEVAVVMAAVIDVIAESAEVAEVIAKAVRALRTPMLTAATRRKDTEEKERVNATDRATRGNLPDSHKTKSTLSTEKLSLKTEADVVAEEATVRREEMTTTKTVATANKPVKMVRAEEEEEEAVEDAAVEVVEATESATISKKATSPGNLLEARELLYTRRSKKTRMAILRKGLTRKIQFFQRTVRAKPIQLIGSQHSAEISEI